MLLNFFSGKLVSVVGSKLRYFKNADFTALQVGSHERFVVEGLFSNGECCVDAHGQFFL